MEMMPLPEGWHWGRLGDMLRMRSGNVDPRGYPSEFFELYSMPAYDAGMEPEVLLGREIGSSKRIVKPKDCLLSRLNPRIPRVWTVGSDRGQQQVGSTDFVALVDRKRPNGEPWFEATFIRYMLLSPGFRSQVIYGVQGATGSRQRLRREDIDDALIPIPPLSEQRRVAARIEALLEEVREARQIYQRIVEDTDRLMDSVLEETVTRLCTLAPRATIKQLTSREMLHISGGGTPSKRKSEYWEGNIPWVSPKDMKSWLIADTQDHITPKAVEESSAKRIPENSVLVVVRGMILARTWPVAIAGTELTINQDMKALTPSKELCSKYLGYVLRGLTRQVLGRVETAAHGTKRLKTAIIESLEIPLPSKSEQNRVVAYLDTVQAEVQAMRALQIHDGQALGQVEQAILAQAFRGEL